MMTAEEIERLKNDVRKVRDWVVRKFGEEAKPSVNI